MTYLLLFQLDVLHVDALDVHFVNFYEILLVENFNADREFASLGG